MSDTCHLPIPKGSIFSDSDATDVFHLRSDIRQPIAIMEFPEEARAKGRVRPQIKEMPQAKKNSIQDSLDRLEKSSIFSGVGKNVLFKLLEPRKSRNGETEALIPLRTFKKGETIFKHGDTNCNHFYVLVQWELSITIEGQEVGKMANGGTVWVMGRDLGMRTAEVTATTNAAMLLVEWDFLEKIPEKLALIIERNIRKELSKIIQNVNNVLLSQGKTCPDKIDAIAAQMHGRVSELNF